MEYALIPLFAHGDERIPLTGDQYTELARAKHALTATTGIEQKFDLLLENYAEYERELLNLGLRLVVFHHGQLHAFEEESLGVTRRLVNILSAARLYIDQVSHDLSGLFGEEHDICAAVKQTRSARYDASFGYRLMETLRNAVQHRSIAGIRVKHHYGLNHLDTQKGDPIERAATRLVVARAMAVLTISDLHDMELKASVRAEIENLGKDHVDLTLHVRDYVDGLASAHYEFRRRAEDDRKRWESALREALVSARNKWPNGESPALNLVALDASGAIDQWTHLFPGFMDYLNALEAKNRGPLRLSRTYVSGHFDTN